MPELKVVHLAVVVHQAVEAHLAIVDRKKMEIHLEIVAHQVMVKLKQNNYFAPCIRTVLFFILFFILAFYFFLMYSNGVVLYGRYSMNFKGKFY